MTTPYSPNPVTRLLAEDHERARLAAERRALLATVAGTLAAVGVAFLAIFVQLHA